MPYTIALPPNKHLLVHKYENFLLRFGNVSAPFRIDCHQVSKAQHIMRNCLSVKLKAFNGLNKVKEKLR